MTEFNMQWMDVNSELVKGLPGSGYAFLIGYLEGYVDPADMAKAVKMARENLAKGDE